MIGLLDEVEWRGALCFYWYITMKEVFWFGFRLGYKVRSLSVPVSHCFGHQVRTIHFSDAVQSYERVWPSHILAAASCVAAAPGPRG